MNAKGNGNNGNGKKTTRTATISLKGETARLFETFREVYNKIPRSFELPASEPPLLEHPSTTTITTSTTTTTTTTTAASSSSTYSANDKQQNTSSSKNTATKGDKEHAKKHTNNNLKSGVDDAVYNNASKRSTDRQSTNDTKQQQKQQKKQHSQQQKQQKQHSADKESPSSPPPAEADVEDESVPDSATSESAISALTAALSASLSPETISSLLSALPSELAALAKNLQAGLLNEPSMVLISPAMPLHFETYTTSLEYREKHDMKAKIADSSFFYPPDSYLQSHVDRALKSSVEEQRQAVEKLITDEVTILEAQLGRMKGETIKHDAFLSAHVKALDAYALGIDLKTRQKAIHEAKEALLISEAACMDAYVVLALFESQSYEASLNFYKKGIEVAHTMSGTVDYGGDNGNIRAKAHLRGYVRCVHGVASTYRKMGKYEDALKVYMLLEHLDPHNNGYNCFVNWRYHVPEVLMHLGRWEETRHFLDKHREEFEMGSTNTSFLWSQALCDYVLGEKKWCREYFQGTARSNAMEGAILKAIQQHSYVLEYLVGKLRLNDINMSMKLTASVTKVDETNCALYASSNLDLWYNTPGAVEYALRHFNTFVAMFLIQGEKEALRVLGLTKVRTKKQFMDLCASPVGIYGDAVVSPEGLTLLHEAVTKAKDDYEFVLGLLKNGASIVTDFHLTPAHMAAYYDAHVITIDAFLDRGMKPTEKGCSNFSPLQVCANQGNWMVLDCILRRCSHLRTKKIFDELGTVLMSTSVFECINGTNRCQRCLSDDMPHSENASIEKCIDVLFKWGWKPSKRTISEGNPSRGKRSLEFHFRKRITQMKNKSVERSQLATLPKKIESELKEYYKNVGKSWDGSVDDSSSDNVDVDSKITKDEKHQHKSDEQGTRTVGDISAAPENGSVSVNGHSGSGSNASKNKCAVCGKAGRLLRCAGCKSTLYCGTLCQKQHWKTHRFNCTK